MSSSTPFYLDAVVKGTGAEDLSEIGSVDTRSILVVAGIHGNEHNAVLAAYRLYDRLVHETYRSYRNRHDIRFILGVNRWGLIRNTREWGDRSDVCPNPVRTGGCVDFNRVFETDPTYSTHTEESASEMRMTLIRAVHEADVVIDVHNSPACSNMVVINNDEYVRDTVRFLEESHLPNYLVWESHTSTLKKYAIDHGKTGFTVELGGMTIGPLDGAVMIDQCAYLKTLVNIVDASMPRFNKGEPLPETMLVMPIKARAYGLIDDIKFADKKAGEVYATMITDSDNPGDAEFRAPCDGRLVACEVTRTVKPGDEIFTWQPKVRI